MKIAIMIDTGIPEPTIKDDLIPNVIIATIRTNIVAIIIYLEVN